MSNNLPTRDPDHQQIMKREQGLARQLSQRQLGMIAVGGAIGTGLFLGSAIAVRTAGPGVILTYVFAAIITLLLMACLAEMAVVHPTAGSFGIYAELYLSKWAGFVIRYTYWAAQSIAIGGEAVAAAIYTQWWFPHTPAWLWVLLYSAALIAINSMSIGAFGTFEYWFAMIKVIAILVFIVLGVAMIFGVHQDHPIGFANFYNYGGFLPHGLLGTWLALAVVIYSFIGAEVVARSAPDGYTLLVGSNGPLTVNPFVQAKLGYDSLKDFAPIALTSYAPHAIILNKKVAAKSIAELIAMSKQQQLSIATSGVGSATHMTLERFKAATGANVVHIPYRSGGALMPDLISGNVDGAMTEFSTALPMHQGGQAHIIAIAKDDQRFAAGTISQDLVGGEIDGVEQVGGS